MYNFAALIVGQGRNADAAVRDAFALFTTQMRGTFVSEQQFPNLQYTTLLTIVMRSFETMVNNHVGFNLKKRTLRYLFTRISTPHEPCYLPFAVGVKWGLAERIYDAIENRADMVYPEDLQTTNAQRTAVTALIDECLRRLPNVPLPLAENNIYAHAHWYLPFLYHTLERMELNVSVQEPVPQNKASKAYVRRSLQELVVGYSTLRKKFKAALEHHVKEAVNSDEAQEPFATRQLPIVNRRNAGSLDVNQRRDGNLNTEQRLSIDGFILQTRASIAAGIFRPEKFTDPRGARLFNLLPIYSMQMRSVQLSPQALSRIIRLSGINAGGIKDINQLCWRLFRMNLLGFNTLQAFLGTNDTKGFTGVIRTDGAALDFVFDRPRRANVAPLTPADVGQRIDLETATIWGVDPGQTDIFVASDGDSGNRHRIRKTSTAEYYHLAGFKSAVIKRAKHDNLNRQL